MSTVQGVAEHERGGGADEWSSVVVVVMAL